MSKADEMKLQHVDTTRTAATTEGETIDVARRRFLRQAVAATSSIAIAEILPSALVSADPQACNPGPEFIAVKEIVRRGNNLQAVIKVKSGANRIVPGQPSPLTLRYFAGYYPDNLTTPVWPLTANAGPGPTLRCEVGDSVQISLLNEVDVSVFQGSLYSGEKGTATGCDEVTKVSQTNPADTNWYPANDLYPNCFHASSASNLHFHGTHVTPSTTGDDILINVQPAPNMTLEDEKQILAWFQPIFNKGEAVKSWGDLPEQWRRYQMGPWPNPSRPRGLVGEYDDTAPYTGPGANPNGRGLPDKLKLWPKNDAAIKAGEWPQYFVGSTPVCFRIPKVSPPVHKMGQAPGTHWYHAHKHGSTSVNLFNGLAGALIITDNSPTGYDGRLQSFYQGRLEERVIIFQQITDTINMMVANQNNVSSPALYVNGQSTPTIKMRKGQIQLWRMINASVSTFVSGQFKPCTGTPPLQCVQTAQDGVQFSQTNYQKQPLGNKGQNPLAFPLAPANRVDLLVQAPTTAGLHVMQTTGNNPRPILFVQVTDETQNPAMQFPPVDRFPKLPDFLNDIPASAVQVRREVNYGSCVPNLPKQSRQPPLRQWTINGKQFEDGIVNQQIKLDTVEEWTIYNSTTQAAHPFHIHVNPFQIVEVFSPNAPAGQQLQKFDKDFVWWDTFAIPTAKTDSTSGGVIASGYFKMRSRFVDFTGLYVHHCHILAHEDRGMMQLVEVCQDLATCGTHTTMSHH
jgi:FtsP/CotA-like multicopper oxidase with cupredoxin domain